MPTPRGACNEYRVWMKEDQVWYLYAVDVSTWLEAFSFPPLLLTYFSLLCMYVMLFVCIASPSIYGISDVHGVSDKAHWIYGPPENKIWIPQLLLKPGIPHPCTEDSVTTPSLIAVQCSCFTLPFQSKLQSIYASKER